MAQRFYAFDIQELGHHVPDDRRLWDLTSSRLLRCKRYSTPVGKRWSLQRMRKGLKLHMSGALDHAGEALALEEVEGGCVGPGIPWIQLEMEGMDKHVIRIDITEKLAYLEERVFEGTTVVALSREEDWQPFAAAPVSALMCEPTSTSPSEVPGFPAGGTADANLWCFARLRARDFLTPSQYGLEFMDALAWCMSRKLNGETVEDAGEIAAAAASTGKRSAEAATGVSARGAYGAPPAMPPPAKHMGLSATGNGLQFSSAVGQEGPPVQQQLQVTYETEQLDKSDQDYVPSSQGTGTSGKVDDGEWQPPKRVRATSGRSRTAVRRAQGRGGRGGRGVVGSGLGSRGGTTIRSTYTKLFLGGLPTPSQNGVQQQQPGVQGTGTDAAVQQQAAARASHGGISEQPVVVTAEDPISAAIAPHLARLVHHLVDKYITEACEDAFNRVLQLCATLPLTIQHMQQAIQQLPSRGPAFDVAMAGMFGVVPAGAGAAASTVGFGAAAAGVGVVQHTEGTAFPFVD